MHTCAVMLSVGGEGGGSGHWGVCGWCVGVRGGYAKYVQWLL